VRATRQRGDPRDDLPSVECPRLFISFDTDLDCFSAIEFGTVDDGQPTERWIGLSEQVGFLLGSQFGPVIGFAVNDFSQLDLEDEDHEVMWTGPHFDAPALGLLDVSAAEICLAAPALLDGASTVNRFFFDLAVEAGSEGDHPRAAAHWRACLQAGDLAAHYGLGYTLFELGWFHEAYRHLRAYTEIIPTNSWAWCWLGHTCAALGELDEARSAYKRALELEDDGAEATDAGERLEQLRTRM
jgi:tetratricopeptide (TPR) repeat protein